MAGGRSPYEEKVAMIAERDAGLVRLRAENKEMADYLDVIEREVSYAYDAVTFGRFSKPNTAHEYVEEAVQERIEKAVEDAEEPLKDEIGGLRAECERLRAALEPVVPWAKAFMAIFPDKADGWTYAGLTTGPDGTGTVLTMGDLRRIAALEDEP